MVDSGDYVNFDDILRELEKDREDRIDNIVNNIIRQNEDMSPEERISFINDALEDVEKNEEILDKLGSDYDENGVPYWDKWEKDGGRKEKDDN